MKNLKENKSTFVSFLFVIIVIALVFYLLVSRSGGIKINPEKTTTSNKNEVTVNIETKKEAGSITKNNMEEKISKNGDVLVMNYTGRLENGTVFDSNVDPKFNHVTPFEFTLGAGQVITGWDEGLLGMKVGEKKTLTIPPEKGYGSQAVSIIPANSTLIFEVELVGIK